MAGAQRDGSTARGRPHHLRTNQCLDMVGRAIVPRQYICACSFATCTAECDCLAESYPCSVGVANGGLREDRRQPGCIPKEWVRTVFRGAACERQGCERRGFVSVAAPIVQVTGAQVTGADVMYNEPPKGTQT